MGNFKYPGTRVTTNGNQLVANNEARICDCGVFYPITPSTEQGEYFELSVKAGNLTVWGDYVKAVETEGEHAAQGGAIAMSVTGKRVVNFTSGQGIVYGLEQYYHAPGKLSTMVLSVGARALTKHALNVHCGHDDIYAAMDTGWTMLFAKDAQQAVDQGVILRKVNELALTPGMNIQDGFLTTHLERTFLKLESDLLRDFLGNPADIIDTPTEDQKELFGPTRRRVPEMYNLKTPILLGSVQNQEHYMSGVVARRESFNKHILGMLENCYKEFGDLTGRYYGLVSGYNLENSDTVFVSIGSSAENMEAASDYIKSTRNENFGVLHINVIRPFPEAAVVKALKGKKNVIVLERTDEPMAGAGPLARDIRTAFSKANENSLNGEVHAGILSASNSETPRIVEGVYGLGSRDFRPEHIIGAYEFVTGKINRQDGKSAKEASFIYLGVDHPFSVVSKETPSLLPEGAIAVRMHSIGGWGAITTGKNMAELMGTFSNVSKLKKNASDEIVHISANPKYGSEKKGAPTNYFLVAAPERIRVNCDLKHVDVVLCCDPKAFIHSNPLDGIKPNGVFLWESNVSGEEAWRRIPTKYRQEVIDKNIRIFTLAGFEIAKKNTKNESLQLRMQGNSFLGAFFATSPFMETHGISKELFLEVVEKQYQKKFGKFGEDVVKSNLHVMQDGFEKIIEVAHGKIDDVDTSALTSSVIVPGEALKACSAKPVLEKSAAPIYTRENYVKQYRDIPDYNNQPTSALLSTGIIAAATGELNSKYVSRVKTPVIDPYKCTQCMSCINVCPDSALPNTAQDIDTVIKNAALGYINDSADRKTLIDNLALVTENVRARMNKAIADKNVIENKFHDLVVAEAKALKISDVSVNELGEILSIAPLGYGMTRPAFQMMEKQNAGSGGLFSIFVSDLCKGCGECITACGDHEALKMVDETPEIRAKHLTASKFLETLPVTPKKYLGKYDEDNLDEMRAALLQNHLMIQDNYKALVAGDGSCAGCGEKSILRGITTMTQALMRPVWDKKVARLTALADALTSNGTAAFDAIKKNSPESYEAIKMTVLHAIMGLGGDNLEDTKTRMATFKGSDAELIDALRAVILTDAGNHKKHRMVDGKYEGMTVMGMTANTGCNSVYGSSHPATPHPYPWMNSLFQDGTTIGWLVGESFMQTHASASVIPERLARMILDGESNFDVSGYERFVHMDDADFSQLEILELPKVWAVGGDGGIGDIGFQNLSKVMLQNRPNVHVLMLDTQVYSNTGGQNSDSSIMAGGFDMNQYGKFTEGKLTERKEVAQIMASGHGSPFVASVSMANSAKFFKAILDGLFYRGSAYIQSFTTCQPEHGVADDMSATQAVRVRDSRAYPEFVFNPANGETEAESYDVSSNPLSKRDWQTKKDADKRSYNNSVVQWAATEGRFRKHFYKIKPDQEVVNIDDVVLRIMQQDVVNRRYLDKNHRSYVPLKGVYADIVNENGKVKRMGVSRHLVLFTVERRKNWRMLQSKAGISNIDYLAQKELIKRSDAKELDILTNTAELHAAIVAELK